MLPNTLIATGLAMATAAVAAPIVPLNPCSFTYMDPAGLESTWPSDQNAEKRSTAITGSHKHLSTWMCPDYPVPTWVVPKPEPRLEDLRELQRLEQDRMAKPVQIDGTPATQAIPKRSKVFASSDKKKSDNRLTPDEQRQLQQLSSGLEGIPKPDQTDEDLRSDNEAVPEAIPKAIPKRSTAFVCSNEKGSNLLPCPDPPINNWGLPPTLNDPPFDFPAPIPEGGELAEPNVSSNMTFNGLIEDSGPVDGNADIQQLPGKMPPNEKRYCIMKDCSKKHMTENLWMFGTPEPSFIGMIHDPAYDTPNLQMASQGVGCQCQCQDHSPDYALAGSAAKKHRKTD